MLSNINTDRIREVMAGLEDLAVIRGYEDPYLNMRAGRFRGSVELGDATVCFGCWLDFLLNDKPHKNSVTSYYYLDGANIFAKYIGLEEGHEGEVQYSASAQLANILDRNPELWGNPYGVDFVEAALAYKPHHISITKVRLKTITNHWRKFADNLEAYKE